MLHLSMLPFFLPSFFFFLKFIYIPSHHGIFGTKCCTLLWLPWLIMQSKFTCAASFHDAPCAVLQVGITARESFSKVLRLLYNDSCKNSLFWVMMVSVKNSAFPLCFPSAYQCLMMFFVLAEYSWRGYIHSLRAWLKTFGKWWWVAPIIILSPCQFDIYLAFFF